MADKNMNIFIAGCGRSGTSMVAGLFHNTGHSMGGQLHAPSWENPKGYFETARVNGLNNRILAKYLPQRMVVDGVSYLNDSPGNSNGWLARIPLSVEIMATVEQQAKIDEIVSEQPFCLKDTRFCYLLPLWVKNVTNYKIICVFRSPELVVESILKSCRTRPGLFDMAVSVNQAYEIWELMNSHLIKRYSNSEKAIFVDYRDVLDGSALGTIESFTGVAIDRSFPEARYNRSVADKTPPATSADIYEKLLALAKQAAGKYNSH